MNTGTNQGSWMVRSLFVLLVAAVAFQGYLLLNIYRQHPKMMPRCTRSEQQPEGTVVHPTNPATPIGKPTTTLQPQRDDWDEWFANPSMDQWDPFSEMQMMQERMSRLFDDALGRFRLSPGFQAPRDQLMFSPQIDLQEKDTNYVVRMDIPGADKSDISVRIEGRLLSVSGKTSEITEESSNGTSIRKERRSGQFQRVITLPGPVASEKMEAKYENGVLSITVPKATGTHEAQRVMVL